MKTTFTSSADDTWAARHPKMIVAIIFILLFWFSTIWWEPTAIFRKNTVVTNQENAVLVEKAKEKATPEELRTIEDSVVASMAVEIEQKFGKGVTTIPQAAQAYQNVLDNSKKQLEAIDKLKADADGSIDKANANTLIAERNDAQQKCLTLETEVAKLRSENNGLKARLSGVQAPTSVPSETAPVAEEQSEPRKKANVVEKISGGENGDRAFLKTESRPSRSSARENLRSGNSRGSREVESSTSSSTDPDGEGSTTGRRPLAAPVQEDSSLEIRLHNGLRFKGSKPATISSSSGKVFFKGNELGEGLLYPEFLERLRNKGIGYKMSSTKVHNELVNRYGTPKQKSFFILEDE